MENFSLSSSTTPLTQVNSQNSSIIFQPYKTPMIWNKEEDIILMEKAKENNYKNWSKVATFLKGRTAVQCSARFKRVQPGIVKGAWSEEEDQELLQGYKVYGRNWCGISKSLPHRTGKQIRDRFLNTLDENGNKERFSKEEDDIVVKWYKVYGRSWSKISKN